jgi:hypothetical protein
MAYFKKTAGTVALHNYYLSLQGHLIRQWYIWPPEAVESRHITNGELFLLWQVTL